MTSIHVNETKRGARGVTQLRRRTSSPRRHLLSVRSLTWISATLLCMTVWALAIFEIASALRTH